MEQKQFSIDITTEDVLRGKFTNTLKTIQGYVQEADNTSEEYYASSVLERMEDIRDTFEVELKQLIASIKMMNLPG
jgi:hypothetical protein